MQPQKNDLRYTTKKHVRFTDEGWKRKKKRTYTKLKICGAKGERLGWCHSEKEIFFFLRRTCLGSPVTIASDSWLSMGVVQRVLVFVCPGTFSLVGSRIRNGCFHKGWKVHICEYIKKFLVTRIST